MCIVTVKMIIKRLLVFTKFDLFIQSNELLSGLVKKICLPDRSLYKLHWSVGHDQCKLSRTCERFPVCDHKITENDRCVIKIIGIH